MRIKCPACSKVLDIPDSAAGKVVKCPCGKQLRAPANPAAQSSRPQTSGAPTSAAPTRGAPTRGAPANGAGDIDPAIFDDLTDQDLRPVKGVVNPYSAPRSVSGRGGKLLQQYSPRDGAGGIARRELAGVGSRILGAIVDGLFYSVFSIIGGVIALVMLGLDGMQEPAMRDLMAFAAISSLLVLIPVVINAVLISKSGQSLGKKLVGTRIIDEQSGIPVGVVQGFLLRSIVFQALLVIPLIGSVIGIVDIIFLFMEGHQTLHDKLAKTIVVKA